jgi:hypothetical protein
MRPRKVPAYMYVTLLHFSEFLLYFTENKKVCMVYLDT